MTRGARKRKRAKIEKFRAATGITDTLLIEQIFAIHARVNDIRSKAYRVVDRASCPESRAILETELCRAMGQQVEKCLMYAPFRGLTVENWQLGY